AQASRSARVRARLVHDGRDHAHEPQLAAGRAQDRLCTYRAGEGADPAHRAAAARGAQRDRAHAHRHQPRFRRPARRRCAHRSGLLLAGDRPVRRAVGRQPRRARCDGCNAGGRSTLRAGEPAGRYPLRAVRPADSLRMTTPAEDAAGTIALRQYGTSVPARLQHAIDRIWARNPASCIGALILLAWLAVAVSVPLWTPYASNAQDVAHRLQGPSLHHLMGTDTLGRDVLSRTLLGSRISLPVAVVVIAVSSVIGTALGTIS